MTLRDFWSGHKEPRFVGGYELIEFIANGGTAQVWRAHDPLLDREVALKIPHGARPAALALFLREAQLAAKLAHPNIVPIHAVGDGPCAWRR